MEDEVRLHLAHLPAVQVDEVVQRLQAFEGDVFETRTQPRTPSVREFDVPIVEKPGLAPPARRPYPVAPHHQPELDRQIKALLTAGIIRRSFSPYSAPVLFTPKKDGTMRMVVDYRQLMLPDLLAAQWQDPFLQQVAAGVTDSDDGLWRDFFRNKEGFFCVTKETVMQFPAFVCPKCQGTLYCLFSRLHIGVWT